MKRTVIGRTGLEVNRLGFGGIPIQRVDEKQAVETVLHAVESGVDFIDTSRAYTTSETRIGMALQRTDKKVVLATKSVQRAADGLRNDIDTSLKELQTDYIDIYQCHFVKNEEDYKKIISKGGALEGLLKAKEEGVIGHTGITSHSLDFFDRVLENNLFDTIMVCFSFLEPLAREKVIPRALDQNVGVLAMKPLSGGVIDNASIALKYALSVPGIIVLAGVEYKEFFDENWRVFQGSWELTSEEQKELEKIRQAYDKAFCRRCDYCQPCSEEIPIQMILGLQSMVKRMGEGILTGSWRADGIAKARNCSGCEECVGRCPYDLPIPELIKERLEWVDAQIGKS